MIIPLPQADSMNMSDDICVDDKPGPVKTKGPPSGLSGACEWPTSSSLTARLRRLITAYQRSYRREQLKVEAAEKGDRRRRRCEQASKLKEIARQERQQRYQLLPSAINSASICVLKLRYSCYVCLMCLYGVRDSWKFTGLGVQNSGRFYSRMLHACMLLPYQYFAYVLHFSACLLCSQLYSALYPM